jgi:REP element-mobilizing transposase RayT
MSVELISSSHSVGEANYHMGFTPAYRRPIFKNEEVWVLTRDYMVAAAKRHGITIRAIDRGTDHCHIFTAECKNHSPAQVAGLLKGFSSYMMRKHHWDLFREDLYGAKFWSGGYFYRTVGAVNAETVERYIKESQKKHWLKPSGQRKLLEFGMN